MLSIIVAVGDNNYTGGTVVIGDSDVKVMALLILEKLCNVPYHRLIVSIG